MKRTTIFAEDDLLNELKELALDEKRSAAELVREALVAYIANKRETTRKRLSFMGIAESGRNDISEIHEDLLWRKSSRSRRS